VASALNGPGLMDSGYCRAANSPSVDKYNKLTSTSAFNTLNSNSDMSDQITCVMGGGSRVSHRPPLNFWKKKPRFAYYSSTSSNAAHPGFATAWRWCSTYGTLLLPLGSQKRMTKHRRLFGCLSCLECLVAEKRQGLSEYKSLAGITG
jgi:hypothetical protein